MKRALLLVILFAAVMASAQVSSNTNPSSAALEKVFNRMDAAAANFKSLEAEFVWDQFQRVVNETDTQKGVIYYRKLSGGVEMSAEIAAPDQKYVLFTQGRVQVYQPKIDQVTQYNAGKNKAAFESFLVLGFGGSGHDLVKSFQVRYEGEENINGVNTAKLYLIPKSDKVRGMFDHIILWIDPALGISVQQQFFESTGDYRLAKYSNIKTNQDLPSNAFKLKTTRKTRFVSPQG